MASSPRANRGLVLGGSSCVGKTTVTRELAERFGLHAVETDHSLPDDPRLDPLRGPDAIWDRPPQELCRLLVSAAEAAIPYLLSQALALAAARGGWILEGERVHPALIATLGARGAAHGLLIVETDAERLTQTLTARLPGFLSMARSRRRTVAEVDRLYNVWLTGAASRHGVAVIDSQPWATLGDRVLHSARAASTPPIDWLRRSGRNRDD